MTLTTVDLFCGCGGMSLGFQNAGYKILAAYDNWRKAINVYNKNFKHQAIIADLRKEKYKKKIADMKPDIIIGGPPCQDFSSAGHRDETLGRADLTITYCQIVIEARPKYFVMENVSRIIKSEILSYIKSKFREAGYGLTEDILDASYCGVPQSRKRYLLIGHLGGQDGFLEKYIVKNLSKKRMSIHDYLGDSLGVEYYFRIPRSYNRRAVFSVYEPCVTIRAVDRPIPPNYKRHPGDLVEIGQKVRALTPIERSYIQTFPQTYIFEGSKTDMNKMIGNAVPVKLAEFIAEAITMYNRNIQETGEDQ